MYFGSFRARMRRKQPAASYQVKHTSPRKNYTLTALANCLSTRNHILDDTLSTSSYSPEVAFSIRRSDLSDFELQASGKRSRVDFR